MENKKHYIYCQKNMFGPDEIIGFGRDDFYIKKIPRKDANAIILKNHYSKKFYNLSTIHLGVFLNNELIGVLQYGYVMNPASMSSIVANTKIDEYLELNRMWFVNNSPPNSKTMALSFSIKFRKKAYPKIKWIQSFADERCKKFGIVYQAANFLYCGEHDSIFWELDGVIYHNSIKTRSALPAYADLNNPLNCDKIIMHKLRQFRYIFFIKKHHTKELLLKTYQYPKHYEHVDGVI